MSKNLQREQDKIAKREFQEQQSASEAETQAEAVPKSNDKDEEQVDEDEWADLYQELGLLGDELASEMMKDETLDRLQSEIDRMIEEEGGGLP